MPRPESPRDDSTDPTDLQDAVLGLLEEAGIDTATNDKVMKLIERAESGGATVSTMTLNLSEKEMRLLDELAERQSLSKTAVVRQALRFYQLVTIRAAAGERLFFEGDDARRAEFLFLS